MVVAPESSTKLFPFFHLRADLQLRRAVSLVQPRSYTGRKGKDDALPANERL